MIKELNRKEQGGLSVELIRLSEKDEQALHNIMQFYIYEFSQFIPDIKLEATGNYKPFDLKPYWEDPNHHAFFIKEEEELVGFALVESSADSDSFNVIEEFFIIRKYSGKGIGKRAAMELFELLPGKWHITQIEKNTPARAFWRKTISDYTNGNYTERIDESGRTIQEFYARPGDRVMRG